MHNLQQCANLLQSGQVMLAINLLKEILLSDSKNVEAQQLLGVSYIICKEYKLAEKHLLKCLKFAPNHLDAKYNLARLYTEQDKYTKAKMNLQSVLKERPDWLQARFALGLAAIGLKDRGLALESFRSVVEVHEDNFEALNNIANIYFEEEQFNKAQEYYKRALGANSDNEDSLLGLLKSIQNLEISADQVQEVADRADGFNSPQIYTELARSYRLLGDKSQVIHFSRLAMNLGDEHGDAIKLYFDSYDVKTIEDLDLLKSELAKSGLNDSAYINMHFAMSKGLDSIGEYELAMEHLTKANDLRRKEFSYTTTESKKMFDLFKQGLANFKANYQGQSTDLGEGLVFILGMPRSGTSLVEQIVSSHSNVFGAGELENLRQLWSKSGSASEAKFHIQLHKKNTSQLCEIANLYIDDVNKLKAGEAYITDKMPHNFLMIGLISAILPKAKVIHCKRHPIANCLSIYKADFMASHGYAFNQKELAEYHNLYEELMGYWRVELPGAFYEVKYEDLTSNQEEETRKLIEYCGLPWEDACLEFYKNKRAVKTVSAYQVRQKMHNKSIDLWKRYGDGLKPLIENLYIPEEYQD